MSDRRLTAYAAFVALALIWGVSFLFIKVGVTDMGPTALVLVRSASGAVALGVLMSVMRRPLFAPDWRTRLLPFAIMAVINALLPWALIAWGEEHITSGLASILNSTATLWTAILIFWIVPAERPTPLNYLGVVIGIAGVVVLVLPDITAHGLSGSVLGVLAVLLAAFSYALAALFQRTRLRGMGVYEQSFGQTIVTALLAIPIAAPSLSQFHFHWLSFSAVVALGVFGTGVAYLLYYYVMNALGAVRATAVTLLVPITAVFWGVVLLGEPLTISTLVGMVVILGGIVLANLRRRPRAEAELQRDSAVA
ncbi:MAG TPA: DMT family transporter [Candidatus Dormibacteraeota bacterium]|nr:DMT family transporter [Candidatus Dormibacteraeota bacterium]